jgi:hypothetical protein
LGKKIKSAKKKKEWKKRREEWTVNYYCNPQCIECG